MQFPLNYNETLIKIIVRFLKLIISQTTCMNVPVTKHIEGFSTFSGRKFYTIKHLYINFSLKVIYWQQLKEKCMNVTYKCF